MNYETRLLGRRKKQNISMNISVLWNVLSIKCPIYEMSSLILSMQCSVYEMSFYRNIFLLQYRNIVRKNIVCDLNCMCFNEIVLHKLRLCKQSFNKCRKKTINLFLTLISSLDKKIVWDILLPSYGTCHFFKKCLIYVSCNFNCYLEDI